MHRSAAMATVATILLQTRVALFSQRVSRHARILIRKKPVLKLHGAAQTSPVV